MNADKHRREPVVRPEQVHLADRGPWRKIPLIAAGIGSVALAGSFGLAYADGGDPQKFYFSYLTALMYWLALGLGGLFFVLVQHAARAGWSIVVRRLAENMALTLPLLGLLILPVVFLGTHDLFHWTHHEVVEADPMLKAKAPYLNETMFTARALVYIAVWAAFGFLYWFWSTRQDRSRDPLPISDRMRAVAPVGLLLFAFTLTFGAFDWLMSLDPHWFSTIFGAYYFAGCVVITHAFLALIVILLHRAGYLNGVVTREHFHDLGKMMFAFTVFWAYIGFSQYFLIWYASIPEETYWYSYRGHGDFLWLSIGLVVVRFVIPFFGIMSRHVKRNPSTLMFWAVWMLVGQFVDMYWLVQPILAHDRGLTQIHIDMYDVTTWLGIGGLWVAMFTWGLGRHALVPLQDPRLEESIVFQNA